MSLPAQDSSSDVREAASTDFHDALRSMREELALSQRELAEAAGLEEEQIAAFEAGEAWPTPEELLLCVKALQEQWDEHADPSFLSILSKMQEAVGLKRPRREVLDALRIILTMPERPAVGPYTRSEDLPEFLTIAEVCAYTRMSRNVVYKAVQRGQIPSVRIAGNKILVPRAAFLGAVKPAVGQEPANAQEAKA